MGNVLFIVQMIGERQLRKIGKIAGNDFLRRLLPFEQNTAYFRKFQVRFAANNTIVSRKL